MQYIRYRDLKQRGLVNSRATLKFWIERDSFPPGRMVGRNTRAWTEQEIDQWLQSRPTAGPPPRGAAKARCLHKANDLISEQSRDNSDHR